MTERETMLLLLAELLGVDVRQAEDAVRERMESLPLLAPPLRSPRTRRVPESRDAEMWLARLNEGLASIGVPIVDGLSSREEKRLLAAMKHNGRDEMLLALTGAFRLLSSDRRNGGDKWPATLQRWGHLWRTVDHYAAPSNHSRYLSAATIRPATTTARPPTEMLR